MDEELMPEGLIGRVLAEAVEKQRTIIGEGMNEKLLPPAPFRPVALDEKLVAEIMGRVLAEVRLHQSRSEDGSPVWLEAHQLADTPAVAILAVRAALMALAERGDVVSRTVGEDRRTVYTLSPSFDDMEAKT